MGKEKGRAVHFTVVLFGGRYRQKDLPDAGSWGGSGCFLLYYHYGILANSPVFCFEYSTYKMGGLRGGINLGWYFGENDCQVPCKLGANPTPCY